MKLKYLLSAVLVLSVIFALPASGAPLSDEDFIAVCSKGVEQDIINAINDGANVNAKAKSGGATPLILAVSGGRTEVVNALIKAGANVNATDSTGNTALIMATWTWNGKIEIVNALLQAGADVNIRNKLSGGTALMEAVANQNVEIVNALIKAGANVNAVTLYGGETVLMTAAEKTKYPEVINALIDAGADVKATNISGQNALDYALRNENLKGSEVLKRLEELSK